MKYDLGLTLFRPVVPLRLTVHTTTYEAAVHGFGAAQELRKLRKEVQAKFPPAQVSQTCLLQRILHLMVNTPFLFWGGERSRGKNLEPFF